MATPLTHDLAIFLPGAYGKLVKYDALCDGSVILVPTHMGVYITMTAHIGPKRAYAVGSGLIALLMWSTTYNCWTCPMFASTDTFAKLQRA